MHTHDTQRSRKIKPERNVQFQERCVSWVCMNLQDWSRTSYGVVLANSSQPLERKESRLAKFCKLKNTQRLHTRHECFRNCFCLHPGPPAVFAQGFSGLAEFVLIKLIAVGLSECYVPAFPRRRQLNDPAFQNQSDGYYASFSLRLILEGVFRFFSISALQQNQATQSFLHQKLYS